MRQEQRDPHFPGPHEVGNPRVGTLLRFGHGRPAGAIVALSSSNATVASAFNAFT